MTSKYFAFAIVVALIINSSFIMADCTSLPVDVRRYNLAIGQHELSSTHAYDNACMALATAAAVELMHTAVKLPLSDDIIKNIINRGTTLYDSAVGAGRRDYLGVNDIESLLPAIGARYVVFDTLMDAFGEDAFTFTSTGRFDAESVYTNIAAKLAKLSNHMHNIPTAAIITLRSYSYALVYKPGVGYFWFDSHQRQIDDYMDAWAKGNPKPYGAFLLQSDNPTNLVDTLVRVNECARAIEAKSVGVQMPGGGIALTQDDQTRFGVEFITPTS